MGKRLNEEREARLQPFRIERCKRTLREMGIDVTHENSSEIQFEWKGETVRFFPYSGWHTGKSIKDGRGFENLINQLTNNYPL